MGIHGIFKEIGSGQRISLAKLSSDHFAEHDRPFRLAIDISIWLFQIQAGKGGSNPALRTFYYRLLRLMTLNIHPLFVFDGPNKPLFKRNKKVGGPGVRVASVPEFLAKQLLKQFGFPWHVAPGEAEAECALLQKEGIVDAVLSEDVDTLMFGSLVTIRNWTPEFSSKVPTHVNIYRATETKEKSGMDREGMILVALMSGGDYITEGIPGCGPKVACDAARAGFGRQLVDLAKKRDIAGLKSWRERLQHEIKTNESKFFTRKSSKLVIPDTFPNREVLGYYTDPCLSTPEKLARLRQELKWDQEIDFPALRSFAADAFDWRCLGGAKKFIRNLAPAMLVRELRLRGDENLDLPPVNQAEREQEYVLAIHGKRNHKTTDAELEYRITFIPQALVPIDLGIEDEDDDFIPAGGADEANEIDEEWAQIPSSTQDEESEAPSSPTKKRNFKPYHPDEPEKIWMMRNFLRVGCPLLVEDYESSQKDPRALLKQRRQARAAGKGDGNIHAKKPRQSKKKAHDMPQGALDSFTTVSKSSQVSVQEISSSQGDREPLKEVATGGNGQAKKDRTSKSRKEGTEDPTAKATGFKRRSTQLSMPPASTLTCVDALQSHTFDTDDDETPKPAKVSAPLKRSSPHFAKFKKPADLPNQVQSTPPRRKRRSDDISSPAMSQQSIRSYFVPSPSPRKQPEQRSNSDIINLVSSSPAKPLGLPRPSSPTPVRLSGGFLIEEDVEHSYSPLRKLTDSVTKRRKKAPLKRAKTAPALLDDDDDLDRPLPTPSSRPVSPGPAGDIVEAMDLASPGALFSRNSNTTARDALPQPPKPAPPLFVKTSTFQPTPPTSRPSSSNQSKLKRRSPRQKEKSNPQPQITAVKVTKKKAIVPRDSLPGTWKEVDAETIDLSGDGSGWKQSGGKATISGTERVKGLVKGYRKSGVEVLDLTGA